MKHVSECIRPSNNVLWDMHKGLIMKRAAKEAALMNHILHTRFRSEEFFGHAWMTFINCLNHFDPSMGFQFSTYYIGSGHSFELKCFVRSDAMRFSLKLRKRRERIICELNADTHEQDYHLYRVPELDDSWTQAILDLFDNDIERVWSALMEPLETRCRDFMRMHFRDGWGMREIGEQYGISHERVRQIIMRGRERMRKKLARLTDAAIFFGTWDAGRRRMSHKMEESA